MLHRLKRSKTAHRSNVTEARNVLVAPNVFIKYENKKNRT